MTIWRLSFANDDIKMEMMSSSWNNFLQFSIHFVVVKSDHSEGLGRVSFISIILFDSRKKEGKKE